MSDLTVQIDPLGAVIALLRQDAALAALVSTRVASKHRFRAPGTTQAPGVVGETWPNKAKAVQITYETGGSFDLWTPNQKPRLDCWCYGEDEVQASAVFLAVVAITRYPARRVVTTAQGKALIYWVNVDGTPQTQWDERVQQDYMQLYLAPNISERAVP